MDEKEYNVRVDLTRESKLDKFLLGGVNQDANVQFLNILLKKLMCDLKFVELGRIGKFFDVTTLKEID